MRRTEYSVRRFFGPERYTVRWPMWIDDASLLFLEETDWKVGCFREEMTATIRDEDFLEGSRVKDTWDNEAEAY
ncbi:MAG: hypothetical protein GX055_11575 [Desulfovibrionales bacterium]|nr:hypothetical protein [Desulfovibrionales bacterium]